MAWLTFSATTDLLCLVIRIYFGLTLSIADIEADFHKVLTILFPPAIWSIHNGKKIGVLIFHILLSFHYYYSAREAPLL